MCNYQSAWSMYTWIEENDKKLFVYQTSKFVEYSKCLKYRTLWYYVD